MKKQADNINIQYKKQYPNLGLAYNKKYWDCIDSKCKEQENNRFVEIEKKILDWKQSPQYSKDLLELAKKEQSFCLRTTYPGLLIGTGYLHEAPKKENAIKLGFHFDYTLGVPVIPGSSVKGVLRSYFPDEIGTTNSEEEKKEIASLNEAKTELICELLGKKLKGVNQIKKLRDYIFEGGADDEETAQEDVFFDALIVGQKENGKGEKSFMGIDYITPHNIPTKNPTPIKMLKIMPDIHIQFNFDLKDIKIKRPNNDDIIITGADKINLFKSLLLLGGIGAKTNIGYGQFIE